MKVKGTEWCPFCEDENDFEVDEKTWIVKCRTCGRPLLLCDRCHSHDNCGNCPHERKLHKMMKRWEDEQIGKVVYWKDPDDDLCSDWCKVIGFNDDVYVLSHLFDKGSGDSVIEAFDTEIEFYDEKKQLEVMTNFFKSEEYKKGRIAL